MEVGLAGYPGSTLELVISSSIETTYIVSQTNSSSITTGSRYNPILRSEGNVENPGWYWSLQNNRLTLSDYSKYTYNLDDVRDSKHEGVAIIDYTIPLLDASRNMTEVGIINTYNNLLRWELSIGNNFSNTRELSNEEGYPLKSFQPDILISKLTRLSVASDSGGSLVITPSTNNLDIGFYVGKLPVLIYQQDLVRELVEALNSSTLIVNTNIDTSYNLTSNISFIQDTSSNYIYNLATIENGEGYRWEILSPNWFTVYNQYREVTSQNTDSLSWNKFQNNSLNSITIDVYRSPRVNCFNQG